LRVFGRHAANAGLDSIARSASSAPSTSLRTVTTPVGRSLTAIPELLRSGGVPFCATSFGAAAVIVSTLSFDPASGAVYRTQRSADGRPCRSRSTCSLQLLSSQTTEACAVVRFGWRVPSTAISDGASPHASPPSVHCLLLTSFFASSTSFAGTIFAASPLASRAPTALRITGVVVTGKSSGYTTAMDILPVPATTVFDSPLQTSNTLPLACAVPASADSTIKEIARTRVMRRY
jgi:hypothetical protein